MKGTYASLTMHTVTALALWALGLAKLCAELSKTARQRLPWFDWRQRRGASVALTCRHFGINRQTFYRWNGRYNPLNLQSLEDLSRRPRRRRRPTYSPELVEAVMITGDNWRTARAVAAQVGIDRVVAEVPPNEKAEEVRAIQRRCGRVAVVGEGINDTPAVMQADVGIAIGAGTDIAIESADIVLVGESLGGVMEAYRIGRNSFAKTVQNVALAFAFNGIGVPAAVTGLVHPVWAMIAMAASVSVVLLNSFGDRLVRIPRRRS